MDTITPKIDFASDLNGLFDMSGQVAFVPGGYGGIGEAIAWGLAMHGAKVVLAGRSLEKAEELAQQISDAGYAAEGISLDVESVDAIRNEIDRIAERNGGIDILMNCVGIQREEPLLEVTEAAYDEVYRVNLTPAMFLAKNFFSSAL